MHNNTVFEFDYSIYLHQIRNNVSNNAFFLQLSFKVTKRRISR